jgi:hypothetical protein
MEHSNPFDKASMYRALPIERPSAPMTLLTLPAEIREAIWQYVMSDHSPKMLIDYRSQRVPILKPQFQWLGLLTTNKQCYNEACEFFQKSPNNPRRFSLRKWMLKIGFPAVNGVWWTHLTQHGQSQSNP